MILRQASQADLAAIVALEGAFPVGQRWTAALWQAELDHRFVLVAEVNHRVEAVASYQLLLDEVELFRVVVAPTHRRRGLARELIDAGIAWARERGAETMLLEVAADNIAARGLYESIGFVGVGRRPGYYSGGGLDGNRGVGADAVLMRLALTDLAFAESGISASSEPDGNDE